MDVSIMGDVAYDWASDLATMGLEDTWCYLIGADVFIFTISALTVRVSNGK